MENSNRTDRSKTAHNNERVKNKDIVNSMINIWRINSSVNPIDVLGSYRGTPYGYNEVKPEQDVDDL